MDCQPGLFFNTKITACDYPANVPECVGGTRAPDQPGKPATTTTERPTTSDGAWDLQCPPVGDHWLAIPEDCSKYLVCSHGVPSVLDCPPGLYFRPELRACDYPQNVPECVGGTRAPVQTERPTTTTERATTTTEATTPTPDPNVLTQCGQTLVANNGQIEYKSEENYEANELCSFILRLNNSVNSVSGFVFTLESHGFNGTADPNAISIHSFDERKHVETRHLGPPNPLTEAFLPGGIAVVVFRTQSRLGTGFRLSYRAVEAKPYYTHSGQNLVYGSGTSGNLTIPFWENPAYQTAIIVLSANHKKIQSSFTSLRLTFVQENLQKDMTSPSRCSYDSVTIYAVNSETITEKGVFCNLYTQRAIYETSGIFILVFKDFEESYWNNHQVTFKWQVDDTETLNP
jgi:hypothetical protein